MDVCPGHILESTKGIEMDFPDFRCFTLPLNTCYEHFCIKLNVSLTYYRGCVVTMECIEKLIKKDMLDPINGKKMTEKDIIPLQRVSATIGLHS